MWFLDAQAAVKLLLACALWTLVVVLSRRPGWKRNVNRYLVVLDLVLIGWIAPMLAAFYAVYALVTYLLSLLVWRLRAGERPVKKWVVQAAFVICCLACCVPFFYIRAREVLPALPLLLELTGIAYNMLKAVDGIYYTYYTEERLDFITYANFMLFFPVITAGPILRYRDFRATMDKPEPVTGRRLVECVKRLIRGYFKKVVVIAFVTILLTRVAEAGPHIYWSVATCALSYFLLWLDMSGYADIAIAMGGCMGVKVAENFKHPLKAASFTQFWRNWHVSLTDWIREHIFVALNGKRLNKYQGALIGFCTMMVMALWHGMSKVFVLDGLLNGSLLAAENLLSLTTVNKRRVSKRYYFLRCLIVAAIFSLDTILYTLTPEQLRIVLRGFVHL